MIIYFNRKPIAGPWGGGSKILSACISAFTRAGHSVVYKLDPGIDMIFCFDPRPGSELDLVEYKVLYTFARSQHKKIPIIQRVGDIGTHGKPELQDLVVASCYASDSVVFPSVWAHDEISIKLEILDIRHKNQWHVIPNAPLQVFQRAKKIKDLIPKNVSFVTHHWSTNDMKGFHFYEEFKKWCALNGHTFTYIGREPRGTLDARSPMTETELAVELPKHDVYVTSSFFEAGANHVLEAMAVGLPVIYNCNGGSINEYCRLMGVSFDGTIKNFEVALEDLRSKHSQIKKNLRSYKKTVDDIALEYVAVAEGLLHG